MKVSIITVTYNSEATIKDTLLSVKNQNYKDIEHIVVDGKSIDNTISLIHQFGHTGPLLSEPDKGIYDAMNKGVKMATGDIVGILNSDDFYPQNDVIEKVVNVLKNDDCDAVYGDLMYVDSIQVNKFLRKWIAGDYKKKLFFKGWMPPHPTVFLKKEVYDKYGLFNLNFKTSSDYELLLRFMFLHNIRVKYIPSILVHMRAGGHSNRSLKNRVAAHREDYMAWKANGLSPKWYTLAMKPLRKITQYVISKNKYF